MLSTQVNAIGENEVKRVCAAFKLPVNEIKLLGKVQNLVFSVNESSIVRFTHASYRSLEALMGEYEFVQWLAERGISAPKAYALENGGFFMPIENGGEHFFASATAKASGVAVRRSDATIYNEKLFRIWGRTMAQMHEAVRDFSPKHPRADFYAVSELTDAAVTLEGREDWATLYSYALEGIIKLGRDKDEYGTVHYDLHCGNFYLNNGFISIFDFDDCARAHFLGDIAVAVYAHTSGRYGETQELEKYIADFLRIFLAGYAEIRPIPKGFRELLPLFMLHRFLILAAFLIKEFDEDDELAKKELANVSRAIVFWRERDKL